MGGTGLGLAIVKHIVNRHRRRLSTVSSKPMAETVSITLPEYQEQSRVCNMIVTNQIYFLSDDFESERIIL